MRLLQRAGIFVVRPFYKALFERPLWWFLAKVKAFFFAETLEHLRLIENRLAILERSQHVEQLFRHNEASNAAQWNAMEQLLLAVLRQPESMRAEPDKDSSAPTHAALLNATELNRVNGPNTLR